jgi:hypothetical protein
MSGPCGKRPRGRLLPRGRTRTGPEMPTTTRSTGPMANKEVRGEEHLTTDLLTNAGDAVDVTCEQANGPDAARPPASAGDLRSSTSGGGLFLPVLLGVEVMGGEIADTRFRILRRIDADDPADLGSPLSYRVEVLAGDDGHDLDPAVAGLSPSRQWVLAALQAGGDLQTVKQLGDRLAETGRPLKPPHRPDRPRRAGGGRLRVGERGRQRPGPLLVPRHPRRLRRWGSGHSLTRPGGAVDGRPARPRIGPHRPASTSAWSARSPRARRTASLPPRGPPQRLVSRVRGGHAQARASRPNPVVI